MGFIWRQKAEDHINLVSLALPIVYRAVPHVHMIPPSHIAVSSGL